MLRLKPLLTISLLILLQCMTSNGIAQISIEQILYGISIKLGNCLPYFQYAPDVFIIGRLTLPNLKLNDTVKLQFIRDENTFSPYFDGSLLPDEPSNVVIEQLQNNQPITYRVDFPVAVAPALLENIYINDNELCRTLASSDSGEKLILQHTLALVNNAIPVYPQKLKPTNFTTEKIEPLVGSVKTYCGKSDQNNKRTEYPWLAAVYISLYTGELFHASGALISERSVLASANRFHHDTGIYPLEIFKIVLGHYDLVNPLESGVETRRVGALIVHPDFKWKNAFLGNDAAIVQLKEPVSFTKYIKPICLWTEPLERSEIIGKSVTLLSYDQVGVNTYTLTVPRSKKVNVITVEQCQKSGYNIGSMSNFICTPRLAYHTDGIMMVKRYGRWLLRGVYSKKIQTTEWDVIYLYQKILDFPYRIFFDLAKNSTWILDNM